MKHIKLFFCLTFTLFTFVLAEQNLCPPADQILPCNCSSNEYVYVVECAGITDMETLVGVFERSGDRTFSNFALHDSSIMYLPAFSLSAKKFSHIVLVNVTMTSLFDQQPDPSNEMELITIVDSRFQRQIGFELFKNLKNLKYFDTENTNIKKLGKSFADNVNSGLTNLILVNTKTQKLDDNAFSRMNELFNIEIYGSLIEILKRSMFATPSKIEKMNFSKNQIATLPNDLFKDMPDLKEVILSRNKINIISESEFGEKFDVFSFLDLSDNPIVCDCRTKWIVSRRYNPLNGRCEGPSDKTGRELKSLKEDDFRYCSDSVTFRFF